jgi:oxalate decarboxylase/phosphoglucose isomerase-like protein (cupin superfamily)
MTSNNPTVSMFTKVGDEEVQLGHCHPAQARKLVKEELAAWQDGKLQLILRPVYADVMSANGSAWNGPLDDPGQMSDGEMKRRRAWFKQLIPKLANAVAESCSKESRLPFTQEQLAEMAKRDADFEAEMREVRERDAAAEELRRAANLAIPDDEVAKFFTDRPMVDLDLRVLWGDYTDEPGPEDTEHFHRLLNLVGVWETSPDVSKIFDCQEGEPSISTCPPENVEPQEALVVSCISSCRPRKVVKDIPDSVLKEIIELEPVTAAPKDETI